MAKSDWNKPKDKAVVAANKERQDALRRAHKRVKVPGGTVLTALKSKQAGDERMRAFRERQEKARAKREASS